jgi:hypothetical protein
MGNINIHHSEIFLSPLLFEDIMDSSSGKLAAGATFVVGKAVLALHPPLGPHSHNANPRDGAQDIFLRHSD